MEGEKFVLAAPDKVPVTLATHEREGNERLRLTQTTFQRNRVADPFVKR